MRPLIPHHLHRRLRPTKYVKLSLNQKSTALRIGPIEYSPYIKKLWPYPKTSAVINALVHLDIYQRVQTTNLPNYLSARVEVPSQLNCDAWDLLLQDYHDVEICQFLRYGWPSSYTAPCQPTSSQKNHPSALAYVAEVERFIKKELSKGALLGPFDTPPFYPWTQNSPLMTAEKKDSERRRLIINLSFPEGESVNAGVARNFFQGEEKSYTLPTVHDLAEMVTAMGPGTFLWKTNLEQAYRQLRSDPLDYPLMGISHKGRYYTDICPSFGCRGSSAAQQRVSTTVCHLKFL